MHIPPSSFPHFPEGNIPAGSERSRSDTDSGLDVSLEVVESSPNGVKLDYIQGHSARSNMSEADKQAEAPYCHGDGEEFDTDLEHDPCIITVNDPKPSHHPRVEISVSSPSNVEAEVLEASGSPCQVAILDAKNSNPPPPTGASFEIEKDKPSFETEPVPVDGEPSIDFEAADGPNKAQTPGDDGKIWLSHDTWVRFNEKSDTWTIKTVLQHPGFNFDCVEGVKADKNGQAMMDEQGQYIKAGKGEPSTTVYKKNPKEVFMTLKLPKADAKFLGRKACVGMILKLKSFHAIYKDPKDWLNALSENQSYGIHVGSGGSFRVYEVASDDLRERSSDLLNGMYRDLFKGKSFSAGKLEGADQGFFDYTYSPTKMIHDYLTPSGIHPIKNGEKKALRNWIEAQFGRDMKDIQDKDILQVAIKNRDFANQAEADFCKQLRTNLEAIAKKSINEIIAELSQSPDEYGGYRPVPEEKLGEALNTIHDPKRARINKDLGSPFMRPIHYFTNERNSEVMKRMLSLIDAGLQKQGASNQEATDTESTPGNSSEGEGPSMTTEKIGDGPLDPPPAGGMIDVRMRP